METEYVGLVKAPKKLTTEIGATVSEEECKALVDDFFNDPNIPQVQKDIVLKRHNAQNKLLDFITYTKPNYKVNWHHELICEELDDFLQSKTRNRLMLFVGPRRGKSEIVSRRLIAYAMGRNPDLKVISASYGAELAKAMSRDTQRIIDSDSYRELFPDTTLNSSNVKSTSKGSYVRTSDKFEIVNHTGAYRAAGVGGPITGQGADLGVIDDPLKDWKDALSTVKKQAIYDWYTSTFYTRLSEKGKVIILMTRWADDDLCGRLLADAAANPEADQWEIISFPEIYDDENEHCHPLDPRQNGDVLWPEMYDAKRVAAIRATVGAKVWISLFQQQPRPGDGIAFKGHWFKYYDAMPNFTRKVVSWDFNFGGKNVSESDFVVGTVWGIHGSHKYLLYMVRERLTFTETLSEVMRVHKLFPEAAYTVIEAKANGPAIVDTVKGVIPGVIAYEPKASKIARALAASPQFEAGNIWLPNMYNEQIRSIHQWGLKLIPLFVEEFKAFPNVDNDDMVDSTTQMILKELEVPAWLMQAAEQENKQEEKPKENQEKLKIIAQVMGWTQVGNNVDFETEGLPMFRLGF